MKIIRADFFNEFEFIKNLKSQNCYENYCCRKKKFFEIIKFFILK